MILLYVLIIAWHDSPIFFFSGPLSLSLFKNSCLSLCQNPKKNLKKKRTRRTHAAVGKCPWKFLICAGQCKVVYYFSLYEFCRLKSKNFGKERPALCNSLGTGGALLQNFETEREKEFQEPCEVLMWTII